MNEQDGNAPTHGEQRLGLLTSSKARVIMRGNQRAWDSLRKELWAGEAADFDDKPATGARAYGHEHEAEGAAKFWERHPEYNTMIDGGFYTYEGDGPLKGWLGSSPDRSLVLPGTGGRQHGLEIKSPTSADRVSGHDLRKHYDQCQHGMLCTGWPQWWLAVHHGELYQEWPIYPDMEWQIEYLRKAAIFHAFCYEGRAVKRRRLSVADLGGAP